MEQTNGLLYLYYCIQVLGIALRPSTLRHKDENSCSCNLIGTHTFEIGTQHCKHYCLALATELGIVVVLPRTNF